MLDELRARCVEDDRGCWLWQRGTNAGYGWWRRAYTHRLAYTAVHGTIPEQTEIDHLCRTKLCCNPDHLEAVSHAENIRRATDEACRRGHPRTPENLYVRPSGARDCRPCRKLTR